MTPLKTRLTPALVAALQCLSYPNLVYISSYFSPLLTLYTYTATLTLPLRTKFENAPSNTELFHTLLDVFVNFNASVVHIINLFLITRNALLLLLTKCTPLNIAHGPTVIGTPTFNHILQIDKHPISCHSDLGIHFILSLYLFILNTALLALKLAHKPLLIPYTKLKISLNTLATTDLELLHLKLETRLLNYLYPPQPLPPSLATLFTPPPPPTPTPKPTPEPTEEEEELADYHSYLLSIPPSLPLSRRIKNIPYKPYWALKRSARRLKRTLIKPTLRVPHMKMYPAPWCFQEECYVGLREIEIDAEIREINRARGRRYRRERDEKGWRALAGVSRGVWEEAEARWLGYERELEAVREEMEEEGGGEWSECSSVGSEE